jgi:hypothetical protein
MMKHIHRAKDTVLQDKLQKLGNRRCQCREQTCFTPPSVRTEDRGQRTEDRGRLTLDSSLAHKLAGLSPHSTVTPSNTAQEWTNTAEIHLTQIYSSRGNFIILSPVSATNTCETGTNTLSSHSDRVWGNHTPYIRSGHLLIAYGISTQNSHFSVSCKQFQSRSCNSCNIHMRTCCLSSLTTSSPAPSVLLTMDKSC